MANSKIHRLRYLSNASNVKSFDDITAPGLYCINAADAKTEKPAEATTVYVLQIGMGDTVAFRLMWDILSWNDKTKLWFQKKFGNNGVWSDWYRLTGTKVDVGG